MEQRDELAGCVYVDTTTNLREVTITASKENDRAKIDSTQSSFSRRMLRHELAEIESVQVYTDPGYETLNVEEALEREDPRVVAVKGTVPIGAIKISSSSRDNNKLTYVMPR
jgi:hypothetical protein